MIMMHAFISERLEKEFENFCKEKNITGKKKEELYEKMKNTVKKASYEPGTAIGVIAAQSVSEPATQMTMRSYTLASQTAGSAKVTQGLPRMIEIFDARKTFQRAMTIYLKSKFNNKNSASRIAEKIKAKKVKDYAVSTSIDLLNMQLELEFEEDVDLDNFKKAVKRYIKTAKVSKRGKKVYVQPSEAEIKDLRNLKLKITETKLTGIKNINDVTVRKIDNDWVIQTDGSNLKKVLALEEVDVSRTETNDIYEVQDVLGIEAARNSLLKEMLNTLNEQGLSVDKRHLLLIADTMTINGEIKSIGRYGVAGHKSSVLARANFEETVKHLVNASFKGERDRLEGTIENIIVGQVAPVGTGFVNLTIDSSKMMKRGSKK